jgi:uncharacterized integral membrane protein
MKLRWNNIIVAILAVFILTLALRHGDSCRAALETVTAVAPHQSVDDRFVGFMVLGLVAVTVVAIVKILAQNRRRDPPEE